MNKIEDNIQRLTKVELVSSKKLMKVELVLILCFYIKLHGFDERNYIYFKLFQNKSNNICLWIESFSMLWDFQSLFNHRYM